MPKRSLVVLFVCLTFFPGSPASAEIIKETPAAESDTELTEEEQKILKDITEKNTETAGPEKDEKPKLPKTALNLKAPETPLLTAPPKPFIIPKDPNSRVIRAPQPPKKIPAAQPQKKATA